MGFSEKLINARKKAGLSQRKLAERSQISLRSIQYYENSGKKPRSKEIYQMLAEGLGIDSDDLMDDDDRFRMKVHEMYGQRGVSQLKKMLGDFESRLEEGIVSREQFRLLFILIQCYSYAVFEWKTAIHIHSYLFAGNEVFVVKSL